MASKAIVALLVLGCVASLCPVPARLHLGAASESGVGRLQGQPAKLGVLPERIVGHQL
jgi:hypothetical protein